MNMNKRFFKCVAAFLTLLLTSCSLLPNMTPSRKRSDSTNEQSKAANDDPYHYHTWSSYTIIKEATCTEDGERYRQCTKCGYEEYSSIPAVGHLWKSLPEDQDRNYIAPSYDHPGQRTQMCSRCGEEQILSIAQLQASFKVFDAGYNYDNDHVYLFFHCQCKGYEDGDIKAAFGLKNIYDDGFMYGQANPLDSDYRYGYEYVEDLGNGVKDFGVRISLATIVPNFGYNKAGDYLIYFGLKGFYSVITFVESYNSSWNICDNEYRYHLDYHSSGFMITIRELQPYFHFNSAELVFFDTQEEVMVKPGDPTPQDVWVRINGQALNQSISVANLQNELASLNPYIEFVGEDNNTFKVENEYGKPQKWRFEVNQFEGIKTVSLYINIQPMLNMNGSYFYTRLNLREYSYVDSCFMEGIFHNDLDLNNGKIIRVFANANGDYGIKNGFRNLAFRIAPKTESAHEHNFTVRSDHWINSLGQPIYCLQSCDNCFAEGLQMRFKDVMYGGLISSNGKVSPGAELIWRFGGDFEYATYSFQMKATISNTPFASGYVLKISGQESYVSVTGKRLGYDFAMNAGDSVYFEMGVVNIAPGHLVGDYHEVEISLTFPAEQDNHLYSDYVRLVRIY